MDVFVRWDILADIVKLIRVTVFLVKMEEQKLYQQQPVSVYVEVVFQDHHVK